MTASVPATAIRAVLHSGLLGPPSPVTVARLLRDIYRSGTNIYTLLAISASRWPHRTAIIDDDGALSYAQLRAKAEAIASELARGDVGPGRAVGIMCRNGRDSVASVFAAGLAGADIVLLNTEFRSTALAGTLSAHRIGTVLCDKEFSPQIREVAPTIGTIEPAGVEMRRGASRPKVATAGRIVLLTSGTTGVPKGVPRAPRISSGLGVGVTILDRTRLHVGSRIALATPMFHGLGFGVMTLAVSLGATMLTRRRFDAEATLAQASLQRADAMSAVPIMLARILDLPQRVRARNPVPALRVVISSGDRLDPSLARRFTTEYGDVVYNLYGSTEAGIGSLATPSDLRDAPETVGRPVAGCPVRIRDRRGRPVGPRVTGRIFVGGDLGAAASSTGSEGKVVIDRMISTGDMGYLDNAGRLYIVGREDDMIVSGGENVYPRALENALSEHPDIAENAVIGVADAQFGRRLAAFVVLRSKAAPASGIGPAEIREYLKGKVSRFEQPRDINIVDSIPRNPAGKVLRRQLSS